MIIIIWKPSYLPWFPVALEFYKLLFWNLRLLFRWLHLDSGLNRPLSNWIYAFLSLPVVFLPIHSFPTPTPSTYLSGLSLFTTKGRGAFLSLLSFITLIPSVLILVTIYCNCNEIVICIIVWFPLLEYQHHKDGVIVLLLMDVSSLRMNTQGLA